MTKTRLKRVVGKRVIREPEDAEGVPATDIDWDADGQLCVVETSFVDPDDDAATAQLRKTRTEAFSTAFDKLSPAAFAAYLGLAHALGDAEPAIEARVLSDRSPYLLVDVVLPSHRWRQAFNAAFEVILKGIATRHVFAETGFRHAYPESGRITGADHRLDVANVLMRLRETSVLVTRLKEDSLPAFVATQVDVAVDLSTLPLAHLAGAVDRAFGTKGSAWPASLPAEKLLTGWFDAACDRSTDPSGAAAMVAALLDDHTVQKAAAARAEQAEPKTTTARNTYVPTVLRPTSPVLADLSGYGAAKAWGESLGADLRLYSRGKIAWADVDAGCLFHGPPGTGKTLFASALAATCGVPFIATSYAQWQSVGDGHLGYVLKSMREAFRVAMENAPCILFIDEIDTIRGRGGADRDGWWSAITTALLECLDGTARRDGVVVIAACNRPEMLDEALVRSGRLDRRFEIGMPDEKSLLGIMRHHLPDADAADLAPAATALAGTASGADVSQFAREARRVARRAGRSVVADDLLAIAMPPDERPDELRRLAAIHEAAHAVAELVRGRVPRSLSIVSGGGAHGGVDVQNDLGCGRLDDLEGMIVSLLSGRAAEEVCLGVVSGGAGGPEGSDLSRATTMVANLVGRLGLGGRLAVVERVHDREVEDRLRGLYGRAVALVRAHRADVEALAVLAMERRVLSQPVLAAFAAERGLPRAPVPEGPDADAPDAEVAR